MLLETDSRNSLSKAVPRYIRFFRIYLDFVRMTEDSVEFAIGYWQNGIAFMVLALLASPIGLPAIANFLLNRMDHILGFFEGLLC